MKTRLTVILGLAAAAIIGAGGLWYWSATQPQPAETAGGQTAKTAPVAPQPAVDPGEVTANFYTRLLTGLNSNQTAKAVLDASPEPTDELKAQLDQQYAKDPQIDPLLCASSAPTSITYDPPQIDGGQSVVVAHGHYGSGSATTISVKLTIQNGEWRITSFECVI